MVRALRRAGFDVLCISESSPRAEDSEVIGLALHGERILLTGDKDFGRLVYSHGQETLCCNQVYRGDAKIAEGDFSIDFSASFASLR